MIKHIHKTIHKMRQQPIETRKQMLVILTLACAAILVLFWSYGFGQNISNKATSNSLKKDLQPFTVLKDNLVDGYKSVSANSTDMVR